MWEYDYTYLAHHGIQGQKWGVRRFQNPDGTYTEAGKDRYYANRVYKEASKRVKKISSDVEQSSKLPNCKLYGLQNKLKTKDSIQRKINKKSVEDNISLKKASQDIKDAVRFTLVSNDNNFVSNYDSFKKRMESKGYKETKCKNYFEQYRNGLVKHKSVQSNFADKDGYEFEVQFQTPSSQDAKDKKVPIYEERRQVGISKKRANELEKQMVELAEKVPYPKEIDRIKSHN